MRANRDFRGAQSFRLQAATLWSNARICSRSKMLEVYKHPVEPLQFHRCLQGA